jgi:hypothetical protein
MLLLQGSQLVQHLICRVNSIKIKYDQIAHWTIDNTIPGGNTIDFGFRRNFWMRFWRELRFEPIREFEVAIDFGTIKTDEHTGVATENRLAPWAGHRFKPRRSG